MQLEIGEQSADLASVRAEHDRIEVAHNMAGGIAHLINNEMQAIQSNLWLLKRQNSDARSTIERIIEAGKQCQ